MNSELSYQRNQAVRKRLQHILITALLLSFPLSLLSSIYQRKSETFCGRSIDIQGDRATPGAGFPIQFACDRDGGYSGGNVVDFVDWLAGGLNVSLFVLNTAFYVFLSALVLWIGTRFYQRFEQD